MSAQFRVVYVKSTHLDAPPPVCSVHVTVPAHRLGVVRVVPLRGDYQVTRPVRGAEQGLNTPHGIAQP